MSQESKTPRTDAEASDAANYAPIEKGWYVHVDFACQLERELAEVTEERDALIASARIKEANSGWRPIETAPRDGSWFVTANNRENDEYETLQYNPWARDVYTQEQDGRFSRSTEIADEFTSSNFHRATHWMPLPLPPMEPDQ